MTAWRAINGWAHLRELLGGRLQLQPFTYAVRVNVGDIAEADVTGVEVNAPMLISQDADFYALTSTLGVFSIFGDQGYGNGLDRVARLEESPQALPHTATIREELGGITLSNRPAVAGALAGIADEVMHWPVPILWKAGTTVNVRHHARYGGDAVGEETLLWWCFHGFKRPLSSPPLPGPLTMDPRLVGPLEEYRRRGELGAVRPFVYAINFGPERPGPESEIAQVAEEDSFTVTDADFLMTDFMVSQHSPTNTDGVDSHETPPAGTIRFLVDEGEVRLDDRPIDLTSWHGDGAKRPVRFPSPLVLKQGQTFTALMTQTARGTNAARRWTYLAFSGVRVYPPGVHPGGV